ncbi:MAG: hypothetical protein QMD46_08105 [Methanomicrobiales archaeon]|nr:hypothetical protein [Methanomicrobiales archaeon]MDI6876208.1 hypothetical protein [Methanomicrobiales archaeon]
MDFFEEVYHGTPPWDIGRPQREFVRLEESGRIGGAVLDLRSGAARSGTDIGAGGRKRRASAGGRDAQTG